jgi:hypothetical protein
MKRISIFLLSLVFVFIPLNPAMAEQDYLDKRWAKTGCKPLNKQTKNALIPTDWEAEYYGSGLKNIQTLKFYSPKLKEYNFYGTGISNQGGKVTRIYKINLALESDDSRIPNEKQPYFIYSGSPGAWKAACGAKAYKGMIYTVYLLKEKNDKKPVKWLQFESTGKGRDDSL